jgi:anthranilate phosphoribosyltransferase
VFFPSSSAGSVPIAKVKSLTHYGEPYDGNTRFFRSSLFVAAVRASYGETCLLHGVDWMPPKVGRVLYIQQPRWNVGSALYWNTGKYWSHITIKCLVFPVLMDSSNMQGGVTEEQMLKHLGANTNLTPKEAVKLLEVYINCISHFIY